MTKIISNFLEKWETERIYFNGSLTVNSLVFWCISVISKHSCTVQVPALARGASEKVPRCAKTVTLRSAGDLFGLVSCIPSRLSRLWKWMFAILMADFCMHLFTHLNLSYMLLREWKSIIFFLGNWDCFMHYDFCLRILHRIYETLVSLFVLAEIIVTGTYFSLPLRMCLGFML